MLLEYLCEVSAGLVTDAFTDSLYGVVAVFFRVVQSEAGQLDSVLIDEGAEILTVGFIYELGNIFAVGADG